MVQLRMITASMIAIAWGTLASAQEMPASPTSPPVPPQNNATQLPNTPSPDQATSTPDQSRAPALEGDSANAAGMPQDVVVTAERRSTSLQRTGVAATVLTGADLAKKGVVTLDDLQFASPSLTVQNSGQGSQLNIRGIGKAVGPAAVNAGVVTYRDGVAVFPGFFQSEPYYDIADIQVLRGPQGTFVGQNATGGAIFITEQDPSLNRVQGYGQIQYGNYNDIAGQGAVNVPLSDKLAVRAGFNSEYRSSFYTIRGPYGGHPGRLRANSGRLSALWQPTDDLRIVLKGDYNNIDKGGYVPDPATDKDNPFVVQNNAPINKASDDFGRIVLNATWTSPGGLVLKSISGYQVGTSTAIGDLDATLATDTRYNFISSERTMSEEFNIISPDTGPFTWVLGGYYQHDRGHYPDREFFSQGATGTRSFTQGFTLKSNAAGFAQAGYQLFGGLQIQGGIRYSRSSSHNIGRPLTLSSTGVRGTTPGTNGSIVESKFDDDAVTGKIALNWTATPNHFFYAFVATGYKSGGLNQNATTPQNQSFDPEHVTDYEAGWKGTFFGGHLRTQLGGYYNRYKDFQLRLVDPIAGGLATFQNAPSITKIYGVEASGQAAFGAFSLDFAGSYLHSEFGTFFATDPRVLTGNGPCNPLTGPASTRCIDLSGRRTAYAPKWTGNVGAQYAIPLRDGLSLTPRINFAYISDSFGTIFQRVDRGDLLVPRKIVNAQMTLAGSVWAVTGYSTNATDQRYIGSVNGNLRYAAPPRQYGIRITRNF